MNPTLLRDLHQAAATLEAVVVTQHVWGVRPGHRDELILRDRATGAGTSSSSAEPLDERLWCLMDYYDPTAIVDTEGAVVERYRFSAFGLRAILDPDFEPRAESEYEWDLAFKGQFLDLESGYYNYGYRYYSPQLGRWLSRDPIGERGGVNLYCFCNNKAPNSLDSYGLFPGSATLGAALQKVETYCADVGSITCAICCFAIGQARVAISLAEAALGIAAGSIIAAGSGGLATILGAGAAGLAISDAAFGLIASYKDFETCKKEICNCGK